ncbi:MAG: DUF3638 domain-containing protein [Puniceicoccales bacterium]|nr:DUF3638 domain-containing protein [Puniceicoccales bacterium]
MDGKITIDNLTNKVIMNGKVLVAPKTLPPGQKPTETDRMLAHFLPFAEETDAACEKVYLYDPMSLDKPVFILKNGKLYTSDDNECEYKSASFGYGGGSEFFHDPRLKMLSPKGETKTGILETIDPDTNEVLSYMMPEVHYNNQILQFNRHADGELHLASNEQYVLSEPPMPNPLANSKSNYICLRDKDKPSSYKFILVNNKSLIDSSSIDNAVRQKVPILNQDVLEIGFTPSEGFSLGSSNYQAAGILLVGKLFEAGENKQALDILNKISMRDVVAGRNNALLQLVFRSLVADASKGNVLKIKKDLTIEGKLATFKIITLLLESNPYNFRNLLLDKGPDGAVVFESSFNLIMQISSLYQSLVDARENSTMEVNLSKENELVIVEEIIGAMSQVLAAAPALQMLMKVTPEKVILNQLPEYGLLKLFEQKHRALVGELGAPSNVKHLTNAAQDSKDHEIVHYQPGGKRSFEKASKFSSALPTRNTEMLARLRQEARATSQLQGSSNVERRKIFSQKCCRSDAAINGDQELSPRQKADYIAFRNAMDFPQFPDGDDENDIIISSIATVYASEIEGFIRSQAPESKHSEALDGENNVRQSIMGGILRPVKASQAGAQADPERDIYDTYKTNLLLDVVQWDEKAIQSNEALTKNDKQLILAFKKKHMAAIHTPEFREQHKLELLDLAKAIGGQGKTFLSNNRQGIAQYESTAERELGRYNEEMSLAGSQDLRASALGELYEINAESFVKAEGEGKSPIESAIDDIAAQIETASKEKTDIENKLKEKFSKCSQTMDNLRKANLAKKLELEDLSDVRKALVCAPSDPNGDWSKSIKILQDVNPDYTDTECKEIVNLTRQLLQTSTAIESMKQMKIAAENVQNKGRALMDASESFPAHGATNLTSGQKDFLLAKNQLLTAYESVRTYDPRTDMEALVFENIVGLRVRGAQASIIRNVTAQLQANEANNEATGITFQLMMGGGKTSVILSQLAHSISLQHKTPLFVCHPSQYTAMLGNLRSFQESRYSQEVISVDESKSDLQDASKLSGILRKIKRANDGGGCLVIQAPTLRAIKLEFIRTSRLAIESKNPEAMARAKQLANILSEVKENCVQLLDEVDLNLDISKSVNFPGGGRKALASSQVDVIASMLDVVTEDPELYDAFCSDKFGMEKDGQTPVGIFKEKIIARCFERIQTLDGSITREDFEKFMLGTEEPSAAFKKAWEGIKGSGQEAEKIALQKGMLSIADSAAKKEYNRHYGFREDGAVIPYQGVGTPSSGEFGNVYEQAYYFFAAVLHNGIQESQMTSLVEMYTNGSLSPSLVEKLESGLNEIGLKLSDLKKMSDAQRNAAIHKTTKQLNANKKSKNFMSFAKMLATNTIKYNSELLECDAVSMVDMSKTTIGCTGTPWNMQTYHSAFQGDDKAILDLGTEGKILQKWKKDFQIGASKILTPAAATVSGILDAHKAAHAENSGNLRALVDAGGVLKDKANEEVARDILDYYKDDPSVEYVIYLGKTMAGEESFFVMKQSDRDNPVPIPNTELKTIEQVVGEGNIGKAFTYFDELRCTGCDIPLDKNARAVLTVNPDTTPIRTALQGILRARKFLDSQTVDLCIPKELIPPGVDLNNDNSLEGMTKICGYCIENQSAMLAKQTYKSYKAQIANCLKGILFERLHEIISKHDGQKISKQEQKIMDLCEKFIYSPFEADPLVLFGGFTSEQNAYEALQNDYESIRAKINKADKSIAREFQVRAQKVLDQGKEVLNFKVQAGAIDTGTEVEAEQEQEQDQEQEQVTEDSGKVVEEKSWAVLNPRVSADGDAPATAQPAEGGQATDAAPQAQKSLEDKAKGTMDDLQSEDFTEGATLESVLKSRMEGTGKVVDLVDQRLQAAARKNELSDRELLIVLNERHNNEEDQTGESRSLLEDNGSLLIDKTKARILATAPSFASLISSEEATAPRILSANECIPSKSDQHVFDANVQITANLAQNLEGVNWMDDSQRKDAQFALVYRSDDGAFKTLFLSDQDSQEIGKAMADLNVRDCWMFNAAGIPTSTNPLPITGEDILAAGRKAATDLAILYGNFHHLNSTDGNRQALQEHIASSPEAKKNFLERVQALQPREYDNALEFLRAA